MTLFVLFVAALWVGTCIASALGIRVSGAACGNITTLCFICVYLKITYHRRPAALLVHFAGQLRTNCQALVSCCT